MRRERTIMAGIDPDNIPIPDRHPSIYRLWQIAQAEGGSEGEMEDRYRELLEEYGHRDVGGMQW